jgi:hypothetical protein
VPPPTHPKKNVPASVLSARRGDGQVPDESLNGGWWRFTDPATQWQ